MNIKLLNEDCMVVMARYPDNYFDLACVDPPYGNKDAIGVIDCRNQKTPRTKYRKFNNTAPTIEYFDELARVSKTQIIWGGNFFGLKGGYICWHKHGSLFGEAELAWCSKLNSVRVFDYVWNGMIQQNMKNKEIRIHPTQKPVRLYDWLLRNYAKPGQRILDTHLGSGSSAIAAHYFKCDFLGCEIDREYYDAAIKRFDQETRQLAMF